MKNLPRCEVCTKLSFESPCQKCKTGISAFRKSLARLSKAAWYLTRLTPDLTPDPANPGKPTGIPSSLRSLRKMSAIQHGKLLEDQDWVCAICLANRRLVIDHDHYSGEVRGLICSPCNTGLGFLLDSSAVIQRAVLFLKKGDSLS